MAPLPWLEVNSLKQVFCPHVASQQIFFFLAETTVELSKMLSS